MEYNGYRKYGMNYYELLDFCKEPRTVAEVVKRFNSYRSGGVLLNTINTLMKKKKLIIVDGKLWA